MRTSANSLSIIFCLFCLVIVHVSHAQNFHQDCLNAHNAARAAVGVGRDDRVAAYARDYANKLKANCRLVHSGGPFGENLAWSSGDLLCTAAVNMWVAEKRYYDYNSNRCVGRVCGHYTQVVWRNSVRLGCAKVQCNNNRGTIITSNYDPPGNYASQRPY